MPNLRGPQVRVRRLYATVVHSVALYGAPIWAESVSAARPLRERAIQLQKASLNKVAMAYRDVAAEVACLLSGTPPLDLLAMERLVLYRERDRGGPRTARHRRELRSQTVNTWQARFTDGRKRYGGEIVNILGPRVGEWVGRGHGNLTYRLTQVLTGHGVFGSYLARIGREETAECWFCGALEDDVDHTVAICPTWDVHRQRLVEVIGPDLSTRGLVNGLLRGPREWSAISRFSEAVLRAKEDREREREKFGVRRRALQGRRKKKENNGGSGGGGGDLRHAQRVAFRVLGSTEDERVQEDDIGHGEERDRSRA